MSESVGPSESSPTKTVKANPISGLHSVATGRAFQALREFQLLKELKCIRPVDSESQDLQ